jgi:microcystin degradation protein MlrC
VRSFVAGIVTETNTFSPIPTGAADWERVDRPEDIVEGSTLDGFRRKAAAHGDAMAFGLYAFAMPAGNTVRAVYEALRDELLGQLRAAMPVDAVFLPLHGAMVADAYDDAEGDLIEKVRAIVGPDVKIGVHIDLHCHLTQRMLDHCDALVIYKEYPHTDMAARAEDLYELVRDAHLGRTEPVMGLFDCRTMGIYPTNPQPMRGFVDAMMAAEGADGILSLSLGHGFPWGDVPDSGARMLAIVDAKQVPGDARVHAARVAEAWGRRFFDLRHEVAVKPLPLDAALDHALAAPRGPVVVADQADNAGGGAPSDSTFVLRRLLERGVPDAALAMMWDPIVVHLAKSAGVGARLAVRLGGKMGPTSGDPLDLDVTLAGIRDGLVQMWPQVDGSLASPAGDCVHLKVHGFAGRPASTGGEPPSSGGDVDVIVTTRRGQVLGVEVFTAFGIDLAAKRVVVVKSIQHFYAAFAPVAAEVVYMAAPGAVAPIMESIPLVRADLHKFPWVEDPFAENGRRGP